MVSPPAGVVSDATRQTRSRKKVLIAEDEPSIVLSLEFLLAGAGYQVTVARNGSDALTLVEHFRPDLVVLDIMLPMVNGLEVCRSVRASAALGHTRILMLTARGREAEVRKGLALGADRYMTKPFSTQELLQAVRELLAAPQNGDEVKK